MFTTGYILDLRPQLAALKCRRVWVCVCDVGVGVYVYGEGDMRQSACQAFGHLFCAYLLK